MKTPNSNEPPWRGHPEPEFMPGLRRHFRDSMEDRVATAKEALERLRRGDTSSGADGMHPARSMHLFGHSLAGTAPAVGSDDMGELGREVSRIARAWWESGTAPPDAAVQLAALVASIEEEAVRYRRWVEMDEDG